MAEGGIQNCGKAANCQAVCPKNIPLMTSWGRAGRAVTIHVIKTVVRRIGSVAVTGSEYNIDKNDLVTKTLPLQRQIVLRTAT